MPAHPKIPIHAVRGAYETGDESIRAIARRYGVSDRAIRKQAKARGWTRSDHAVALRQLTERDRAAIRAAMSSPLPTWPGCPSTRFSEGTEMATRRLVV